MKKIFFLSKQNEEYMKKIESIFKEFNIEDVKIVDIRNFDFNNNYGNIYIFSNLTSSNTTILEILKKNKTNGGYNIDITEEKKENMPYVLSRIPFSKLGKCFEYIDNKEEENNLKRKQQKNNNNKDSDTKRNDVKEEEDLALAYAKDITTTRNAIIITFFAPKGGTGKTQSALLSSELARRFLRKEVKVIFVDTNYTEGSFSKHFVENDPSHEFDAVVAEYKKGKDITAVLRNAIAKNPTFLSQSSYKLEGIDVLFAPRQKEITIKDMYINHGVFDAVFTQLRRDYDIIFVDASNEKSTPINNYLFKHSTMINLVINTDSFSMEQTREFVAQNQSKISTDIYNILYNDYNKIDTTLEIENIVGHILGATRDEIENIMNTRLFIVPSIRKLRKINNMKDGAFNPEERHLTKEEAHAIISAFKKMFRRCCPSYINPEQYSGGNINMKPKGKGLFSSLFGK